MPAPRKKFASRIHPPNMEKTASSLGSNGGGKGIPEKKWEGSIMTIPRIARSTAAAIIQGPLVRFLPVGRHRNKIAQPSSTSRLRLTPTRQFIGSTVVYPTPSYLDARRGNPMHV